MTTTDPIKENNQPDQSVDHLDFQPRCSVGHAGGARRHVHTGENFEPCEREAVFVSKVHGHTKSGKQRDMIHLWCLHHLKTFRDGFQEWISTIKPPDYPGCEVCKQQFDSVEDLIFDLKTLD